LSGAVFKSGLIVIIIAEIRNPSTPQKRGVLIKTCIFGAFCGQTVKSDGLPACFA